MRFQSIRADSSTAQNPLRRPHLGQMYENLLPAALPMRTGMTQHVAHLRGGLVSIGLSIHGLLIVGSGECLDGVENDCDCGSSQRHGCDVEREREV